MSINSSNTLEPIHSATKVSTFFKNFQSMCGFSCEFQLHVYENISYKIDERSFLIDSIYPADILTFFSDYYVYLINPSYNSRISLSEGNTSRSEENRYPVMKMLICKNRPAGSFWTVTD